MLFCYYRVNGNSGIRAGSYGPTRYGAMLRIWRLRRTTPNYLKKQKLIKIITRFNARPVYCRQWLGYGLNHQGTQVLVPTMARQFLFFDTSREALASSQPHMQLIPGALPPEVERLGRETDRSLPSSAAVKNKGSCNSTSPYAFRECWGTKLQGVTCCIPLPASLLMSITCMLYC
jgi:hypothetical protein